MERKTVKLLFPICVLIFVVILFGFLTEGKFLTVQTFNIIFNQGLIIATVAIAVSFIYTTGNIDISVGSVLGLAAALGALAYNYTGNAFIMIIVSMGAGTLMMLFNSTMSVIFRIRTITVAVVMIQLYNAILSWILGPNQLKVDYVMAKNLENDGFRYIAFIIYFILCFVIYHLTPIGRTLRFIGGNEECAKQTGMSPKSAVMISFLLAGIGIGLGAAFTIIRTGTVSISTGDGMGMNVMMATVLGGMSIFGGAKSNSYSGLLGAMTAAVLNSGMVMAGVSNAIIQGVRGVIFLILVFLYSEHSKMLPSRQQV